MTPDALRPPRGAGGLPLIVTRPEPGCTATVERARTMGIDARAAPLFEARAMAWDVPDPGDFDALLLTSAQAPRLAGPALASLAALPVHAVGAATADAARAAGLSVAATGEADGQALVDAATARGARHILWLCGAAQSALSAAPARLVALPCYRVDPVDPPPFWAPAIAAPAAIMAYSRRAARRIAALCEARNHLTLIAISPAVAEAAGPNWYQVAVADRPNDAAMLARAGALCHKGAT